MKRLQEFIYQIDALVRSDPSDPSRSAVLPMQELVTRDDWLPASMAESHPTYYQQHLIYADPEDRYSIVSFVWGPGQHTPIHNHTVWGVIGVLRGAEYAQRFDVGSPGAPRPVGPEEKLVAGAVDVVSPTRGDVHQVRNAFDDRVSISIHLYGGNIGRVERQVFDASSGQAKPFVSGYSKTLPVEMIFPQATR